jgi:hypothetical protein
MQQKRGGIVHQVRLGLKIDGTHIIIDMLSGTPQKSKLLEFSFIRSRAHGKLPDTARAPQLQ